MSSIAMHMGRPVARGGSPHSCRRFAERVAGEGASPNRQFEWTETGKLMAVIGQKRRFTGWEVVHVPHVRALA